MKGFPLKAEDVGRKELDNGAVVLAIEYPKLPLLKVHLMVKRGAERDPQGQEGLADLTAEGITLGTEGRGSEEIASEVERLGAKLSASSRWDASFLTLAGLMEDAPRLIEILSDLTLHPTFPREEIGEALKRKISRLLQLRDEPEVVADEIINGIVMEGTPYAHPTYGTLRSLKALPLEAPSRFWKENYLPQETVLLLIGSRPKEELLSLGEEALGEWEGRSSSSADLPHPRPPGTRRVLLVDRPDLTQSQIRVGLIGIERSDERYLPFLIMNYIFGGGGFSSRLMMRVRASKGYTYGIRSTFQALRTPGPFLISTFSPTATTPQALEEILRVMEEMAREGVTEKELEEAKNYWRGSFPLQMETPAQVARRVLELELYGLPLEDLPLFPERVAGVRKEEVDELAAEFIRADRAQIVILGKAEEMEPSLRGLGEVEVRSFREVIDAPQ